MEGGALVPFDHLAEIYVRVEMGLTGGDAYAAALTSGVLAFGFQMIAFFVERGLERPSFTTAHL